MDFSFFVHMERMDKNQSQKQLYDEYIELCLIAGRVSREERALPVSFLSRDDR